MLFFQTKYKGEVVELLAGKEHISDGIGSAEFVHIILMASATFFLISFSMIAYMIRKRKYEIQKKLNTAILIDRYQNFLSGFLVLPIDDAFLGIQKDNRIDSRLTPKDISIPKRRRILAQEIYKLKKDLIGQQENQLTNYFFGLGLQVEVLDMLSSNSWTKKIVAMQMVDAFGIVEALPRIHKYINHKNRELAIHAIMVRLSLEKSLAVLKDITHELNDWECHKIIHSIKNLNLNEEEKMDLESLASDNNSPLFRLMSGLKKEKKLNQNIHQFN